MITTVKHKILLLLGTLALLVLVLYLYHWSNDFKPIIYAEGDFGYKLGFSDGLIDGAMSVCALISSFFVENSIYAGLNSGLFYNLGFAAGIAIWLTSVINVFMIDNSRANRYNKSDLNKQ